MGIEKIDMRLCARGGGVCSTVAVPPPDATQANFETRRMHKSRCGVGKELRGFP